MIRCFLVVRAGRGGDGGHGGAEANWGGGVRGGLSEEVISEDRPEGVSEPVETWKRVHQAGNTVSAKAPRWHGMVLGCLRWLEQSEGWGRTVGVLGWSLQLKPEKAQGRASSSPPHPRLMDNSFALLGLWPALSVSTMGVTSLSFEPSRKSMSHGLLTSPVTVVILEAHLC